MTVIRAFFRKWRRDRLRARANWMRRQEYTWPRHDSREFSQRFYHSATRR